MCVCVYTSGIKDREGKSFTVRTDKLLRSYLCILFLPFYSVFIAIERRKGKNSWSEESGEYGRVFSKPVVCVCEW